jgi:cell division protein FtsX
MPSIFELTKEQSQLKALIESGELSQEDAADTFEGMEHELDSKIDSYCHVLNHLDAQLTAIQNEKTRYAQLEAEKKNEIKRVKQTLLAGLSGIEKTKFDTGHFKGHIRKGSQSVKVIDANEIPAEYIEVKVTEQPDKTAIKNALKAGDKIQGVELVTGDSSLIIK